MSRRTRSNLIKIVGAGHGSEYTSAKRAVFLVERGKAEWVSHNCIAFKEHEQFVKTKTHTDARIPGAFEWQPRLSAGFNVMQARRKI